jgi:hypothetical protein
MLLFCDTPNVLRLWSGGGPSGWGFDKHSLKCRHWHAELASDLDDGNFTPGCCSVGRVLGHAEKFTGLRN